MAHAPRCMDESNLFLFEVPWAQRMDPLPAGVVSSVKGGSGAFVSYASVARSKLRLSFPDNCASFSPPSPSVFSRKERRRRRIVSRINFCIIYVRFFLLYLRKKTGWTSWIDKGQPACTDACQRLAAATFVSVTLDTSPRASALNGVFEKHPLCQDGTSRVLATEVVPEMTGVSEEVARLPRRVATSECELLLGPVLATGSSAIDTSLCRRVSFEPPQFPKVEVWNICGSWSSNFVASTSTASSNVSVCLHCNCPCNFASFFFLNQDMEQDLLVLFW